MQGDHWFLISKENYITVAVVAVVFRAYYKVSRNYRKFCCLKHLDQNTIDGRPDLALNEKVMGTGSSATLVIKSHTSGNRAK